LATRRFSKYGDAVRHAIDDGLKKEFDEELGKVEVRFGAESDTVAKLKSLDQYTRDKFIREGLNVLLRNDDLQDLSRIRRIVTIGKVALTDPDVNFLGKHGGWGDLRVIISALECSSKGLGNVFLPGDQVSYDRAAQVIYKLSKGRLDELLAMGMLPFLMESVVTSIGDGLLKDSVT
jgi:hypothetical protein